MSGREDKISRYLRSVENGATPSGMSGKKNYIKKDTNASKLLRFIAEKPRTITDVKVFFDNDNPRVCQSSLVYLCKLGKIRYVPGHYELVEGEI